MAIVVRNNASWSFVYGMWTARILIVANTVFSKHATIRHCQVKWPVRVTVDSAWHQTTTADTNACIVYLPWNTTVTTLIVKYYYYCTRIITRRWKMGARTCATSVSLQTAGELQRSWAGHRQPTMCQGSSPLVPATLASTLHAAAAWWSGARASRRLGWTLLCQRTCVRRFGVPYMMMNVQHKHHDEKGSTRYSVVMKWSNYNYSKSVEKVIKKMQRDAMNCWQPTSTQWTSCKG